MKAVRAVAKKLYIILPLVLLCGCGISDRRDNGAYHVRIDAAASRTSGVAPLSVHFTAGYSNSTSESREFHNRDYAWDFGDDDAAVWGTTGKSKNTAKGPVAVHVFESPGEYTVNLTVTDGTAAVDTQSFDIEVLDPDTVYDGANTVCVSDETSNDFAGCPDGAAHVAADDLDDIVQYIDAGTRILLGRGSSWTTGGLTVPGNAGPVTIGAYGAAGTVDDLGICDNAPLINVAAGGEVFALDYKQDWRITDLHLVNADRTAGTFGGAINMQRILFQRLRVEGFHVALGWSHWNGADLMIIDQMTISDCDLSDTQNCTVYIGGERIALMGSLIRNSMDTHVTRVWQAYLGVISNNIMSGSSLESDSGRHALKLHGPGYSSFGHTNEYGPPREGTGLLAHRTEFAVVSDNVFGSSGPWPVAIGPQDTATDSLLTDIIFEKNRIITNYGEKSALSQNVNVALHVAARFATVRNNVFDGTGSGDDYAAVEIWSQGDIPRPVAVEVYNNTVYRSDNASGWSRTGISVGASARKTIVMNNLVSFPNPGSTVQTSAVYNSSPDLVEKCNLLAGAPGFTAPDNAYADDPYVTDFSLLPGSAAIDAGVPAPVYDDMDGVSRPRGDYDIGAYEN